MDYIIRKIELKDNLKIASVIRNVFEELDAPVKRVASLDTPVPFAVSLENQFLPKERLTQALNELLNY